MTSPRGRQCPKCLKSVGAPARFCKYCAFDFSTIPAEHTATATSIPATTAPKWSNRVPLMLGALGLLLIILLIIGIGAWLYKRNLAKNDLLSQTPVSTVPSTVSDKSRQIEDRILSGGAITDADISGLSAYELRILRNVHFARYGRKYERPGLGDYFFTRSWYQPRDDFNENMLTDLDRSNIQVIQAAEDRIIVGQSRSWDTFWSMVRDAAQKKDRGTLMKLMPSDFEYDCCSGGDENNNGDTRDDAFRWWGKTDINGWEELNKALSIGAVSMSRWPDTVNGRQRRVAPPSANQDKYSGWLAIFELREDGRWYFVS